MSEEPYAVEKEKIITDLEGLIERVKNTNIASFVYSHENILSDPVWREGGSAPPERTVIGFMVKIRVEERQIK